jgi:hypothetical protein
MSKKRPQKPPLKKRSIDPIPEPSRSSLGKLGSFILSAIAVIGFVLLLWPRITVTPSDPVDPTNALSTLFTIANSGFIPLRKVSAALGLGEIQPVGKPLDSDVGFDSPGGLAPVAWSNHSLDVDDSYTISPFDIIHAYGDRQAAIQIVVQYNLWLLPRTFTRRFRFETRRQSNGKLYWYSIPAK